MAVVDFAPPCRPLFLSPHLDDAVFACGRLLASLADPVVATVFAGSPPPGGPLTDWDCAAGFAPGEDIVALRREEDRQALAMLGARPWWMPLLDSQYAPSPSVSEIADELRRLLGRCTPDAVFFPLGLFHSDHRRVRESVLMLRAESPAGRWFAYEDALYRRLPGEREAGLAALRQAGLNLVAAYPPEAADAVPRKRAAVGRYRSQLQALTTPGRTGLADLDAPEAYWAVLPAGAAR